MPIVVAHEAARKSLVWETRFVMVAFLLLGVTAAVVLLAQHVSGVGNITRFPVLVHGHPFTNMFSEFLTICRSLRRFLWRCFCSLVRVSHLQFSDSDFPASNRTSCLGWALRLPRSEQSSCCSFHSYRSSNTTHH